MLEGLAGTPGLTVLHADRNRGKGAAIRLGLAQARGTIIAIQDADLELDPAQLAGLVAPILSGTAAVVYGSRFMKGRTSPAPLLTRVANRVLTTVTNVLYRSSLTDMETCYKIMRGDVARSLELTANRFGLGSGTRPSPCVPGPCMSRPAVVPMYPETPRAPQPR